MPGGAAGTVGAAPRRVHHLPASAGSGGLERAQEPHRHQSGSAVPASEQPPFSCIQYSCPAGGSARRHGARPWPLDALVRPCERADATVGAGGGSKGAGGNIFLVASGLTCGLAVIHPSFQGVTIFQAERGFAWQYTQPHLCRHVDVLSQSHSEQSHTHITGRNAAGVMQLRFVLKSKHGQQMMEKLVIHEYARVFDFSKD